MRTLDALIDEAANLCSSDAALARRIGKSRSQIADMRAGREPISPETVGLLCDVLELDGDEARRLLALAVIENPKNEGKRRTLARAFFGCWVPGVVLALLHLTAEANSGSLSATAAELTVYTSSRIRRALRSLRDALHGAAPHTPGRAAPACGGSPC